MSHRLSSIGELYYGIVNVTWHKTRISCFVWLGSVTQSTAGLISRMRSVKHGTKQLGLARFLLNLVEIIPLLSTHWMTDDEVCIFWKKGTWNNFFFVGGGGGGMDTEQDLNKATRSLKSPLPWKWMTGNHFSFPYGLQISQKNYKLIHQFTHLVSPNNRSKWIG